MLKEDDTPLVAGFDSDKLGWEETLSASGGVVLVVVFLIFVVVTAIQRIFF